MRGVLVAAYALLACLPHSITTSARHDGAGGHVIHWCAYGPIAQWQSSRLITGSSQVRTLLGPPCVTYGCSSSQRSSLVGVTRHRLLRVCHCTESARHGTIYGSIGGV